MPRSRKSKGGNNRQNKSAGARRRKRAGEGTRNATRFDDGFAPSNQQLGAVLRTRFPSIGMSDIRKHRISWICGYTFVGNGTNGAANSVLLQTAGLTYLMGNTNSGNLGAMPILAGDSEIGATYVADLEKHFARKRINKMWLHVCSLQPSTANNMMAVVAVARGPGIAQIGIAEPTATATQTQQTFTNVISMEGAMTVDSFESKTLDITRFIAGGDGPLQNEFEIGFDSGAATTVLSSGGPPGKDLIGICPASIIVSGNNTTSGLQNTTVHALVIEQEVDLIDYLGGSAQTRPVD